MDSRTAAHTLTQIASLLDALGEQRFKVRAYRNAARAVMALDTDDLAPLLASGELARTSGIGKATLGVVRDLVENGESSYLARLREGTPAGLPELMRIPGLGLSKLKLMHEELGIETVEQLAEAARDGRLAELKGFGPKTAERILEGIQFAREAKPQKLYIVAAVEADMLLSAVSKHPDIPKAEVAGSVRRRMEIVGEFDIVAGCSANPAKVARSFERTPGVREFELAESGTASIRYVDEGRLELHCVRDSEYALALWRATGSPAHVRDVEAHIGKIGWSLEGNVLRDKSGKAKRVASEKAFYNAIGLEFIAPELREGRGEVAAARNKALPTLLEYGDIRGALHCHSTYSDGTASIPEMARAARDRGWEYIGITDHSQAAFYAGGLKPDDVKRQHDEIDHLNAKQKGFRILKGIEADILQDGSVDYGERILESFDYVVGSIHARFKMDGPAITKRVMRALDDPFLTILAHPTGRLLLSRAPYDLDVDAVIGKAVANGIAVELNCDPHRLDLDWRYLKGAKEQGATIEIGPDAHSTEALGVMEIGVGLARKGWLERGDILNTRSASDVIAFARARRA